MVIISACLVAWQRGFSASWGDPTFFNERLYDDHRSIIGNKSMVPVAGAFVLVREAIHI